MTARVLPADDAGEADLLRRFGARFVDWLVVGAVSAFICWPLALWAMNDIVSGPFQEVLFGTSDRSPAESEEIADRAVQSLYLIAAGALVAQVGVVVLYEWITTVLSGSTWGKSMFGVQVDVTPSGYVLRLLARSLIAVVPGGLAVAAAVLGMLGVSLAWLAFVACLFLLVLVLVLDMLPGVSRYALHDLVTGTRAVRIDWATALEDV